MWPLLRAKERKWKNVDPFHPRKGKFRSIYVQLINIMYLFVDKSKIWTYLHA